MLKKGNQDEGLEGWTINFAFGGEEVRPVPWKSDPWKVGMVAPQISIQHCSQNASTQN